MFRRCRIERRCFPLGVISRQYQQISSILGFRDTFLATGPSSVLSQHSFASSGTCSSMLISRIRVSRDFVINTNKRPLSFFPGQREWHNPNFLHGASVQTAEAWLQSLINKENNNINNILPQGTINETTHLGRYHQGSLVDVRAYLVVFTALARSSKTNNGAPQRAEEWMGRLERRLQQQQINLDSDDDKESFVECINNLIKTWANSKEETNLSVVRTERWINKLMSMQLANTGSFNAFLDVCSRGRAKQRKNIKTYNKLSKNQSIQEQLVRHAQKAEDVLSHMMKQYELYGTSSRVIPTTESFNYVIRAWTRCKKPMKPIMNSSVSPTKKKELYDDSLAVDSVMRIIRKMESFARNDPGNKFIQPNTMTYCQAMDAYSNFAVLKARQYIRNNNKKKQQEQQHNEKNNRSNMGASSSERNTENGLQEVGTMEDLLKYIHDLHDAGHPFVEPDTVAYNILITVWSRLATIHDDLLLEEDPPLQAEQILRKMKAFHRDGYAKIRPDFISYTKVILTWVNAKKPNSGTRCEFWLQQLWDEYESENDENLCPQADTYNTVMKAWSNLNEPTKVEEVMNTLISLEKKKIHPKLRTDTESFYCVINAWLKYSQTMNDNQAKNHMIMMNDNQYNGIARAASWLEELSSREESGEFDVTTTPDLYASILKAARKSSYLGNLEMLDLAIKVFDKYRASRHHVDHFAYTWMLQMVLKTLATPDHDEARTNFVRQLFQDCCDNGLVTGPFVRALSNGPVFYSGFTLDESHRLTHELFGHWPLPLEWSRNVKDQSFLPLVSDTKRHNFNILDI